MKRRVLRYLFLGSSGRLLAKPYPVDPSCWEDMMPPKSLLIGSALLSATFGAPPATQAAQTCNDAIVASAPDSRYQDNGDGTVTDLATGLIWKQCAEGLSGPDCATGSRQTFTWQAALQHAEAAVFAGSSLWRLPNKNELATLPERRCSNPAINTTFFPNTPSSGFWSSSPYANLSSYAWYVYFYYGTVLRYGYKYGQEYVRLVRDGQ